MCCYVLERSAFEHVLYSFAQDLVEEVVYHQNNYLEVALT